MDSDSEGADTGVTPDQSTATGDNGQSEQPPSWFSDYVAKQDAKMKDAFKRLGKLNERVSVNSEKENGSNGVPSAMDGTEKSSLSHDDLKAYLSLEGSKAKLSSEGKERLQAFEDEGLSVSELSRIARIMTELSPTDAKSVNRRTGHSATPAHSPADADIPTNWAEAHEILTDPSKRKAFDKKHPGFDWQSIPD